MLDHSWLGHHHFISFGSFWVKLIRKENLNNLPRKQNWYVKKPRIHQMYTQRTKQRQNLTTKMKIKKKMIQALYHRKNWIFFVSFFLCFFFFSFGVLHSSPFVDISFFLFSPPWFTWQWSSILFKQQTTDTQVFLSHSISHRWFYQLDCYAFSVALEICFSFYFRLMKKINQILLSSNIDVLLVISTRMKAKERAGEAVDTYSFCIRRSNNSNSNQKEN